MKELYRLDPALRDREAELKKAIEELLGNKPQLILDRTFEKRLRKTLLRKFAPESKRPFIFSPGFRAVLAGSAAFCILILALYIALPQFNKQPALPEKPALETVKSEKVKSPAMAETGKKSPAGPLYTADNIVSSENFRERTRGESKLSLDDLDDKEAAREMEPKSEIADQSPAVKNYAGQKDRFNTESYDRVEENEFMETLKDPLSTFSIDVDTASYANIRRFINEGSLPYPDAVRIEEMINYFPYDYKEPEGDAPLAFNSEISTCPWNPSHTLIRIGLQAKKVDLQNLPPNNLVFLIDVSGSMDEENKLPLVKSALKLLVNQMRSIDRISIVVYAGNAGLVLPPTPGNEKRRILDAIDSLEAGGSTAGGEGIILAYAEAKKYYNHAGNNRVILATDGDFNVGASSDGELVRMIEEKRNEGIYLTVLGFGMGNYKDSKMEKLADNGNGNYAYIDTLSEAEKVLVREMSGTLLTLAKDVKIQIEFNPLAVGQYRLIGYEKRLLKNRDFDDDKKDAGELGAGQCVTALYELIPALSSSSSNILKYQTTVINTNAAGSGELLTIKFRYKKPDEDKSRLLTYTVPDKKIGLNSTSENFRFASAVAEWGLILRSSKFKGSASEGQVIDLANSALGSDPDGYRHEFVKLVKLSKGLKRAE